MNFFCWTTLPQHSFLHSQTWMPSRHQGEHSVIWHNSYREVEYAAMPRLDCRIHIRVDENFDETISRERLKSADDFSKHPEITELSW